MIVILFPAGGFGSTVEYSIRQFSNELTSMNATVLDDGSMHSFKKEFHPTDFNSYKQIDHKNHSIITPTYPGHDYESPTDSINEFKKHINPLQKVVLIYFSTTEMAERNIFFCYYKINEFLSTIMKDKQLAWNPAYSSYKDMQSFELREALSFYVDQEKEYLKVINVINKNWLSITPDDLLYDFKNTILKIINYSELTVDTSKSIDKFYIEWFQKQQYILNEYATIVNIMDNFKSNSDFSWNKLSIVGEAIVQSRLRKQGLEILCYNLNQFPTDIYSLKQVTFTEPL